MHTRIINRFFVLIALLLSALLVPTNGTAQHNRHDARALRADPHRAVGQLAPVLTGLGNVHFPVTTTSERAQAFFDQGLRLTYGFNHQEALRAFKEAVRLDQDFAMAYWGWALVLGPNINLPMQENVVAQAYEAIQTAMSLRHRVTEKERAFIEALAERYTDDPAADRTPFDGAYARAMRRLHQKYPDDPNAATLFAAALMNLTPWDYWTEEGQPTPNTEELLTALEKGMEINPEHTGALHYYIHAVEPVDPDRGEAAADALRGLAPGIGHLVHMPSHIYMQLGRYADSFEVNRLAAEADEGYIAQCRAQGMYPLNYYPHNVHFLAWAAVMQGRSQEALAAARKVASRVPDDHSADAWALYQTFLSLPTLTMARFGQWEDVLQEPAPSPEHRYATGIWHYARGLAFVHTGALSKTKEELRALIEMTGDPELPEVYVGLGHAEQLLAIAREVLAGEIAAREERFDTAVRHLDRAVRLEDALAYNEPPDWFYPVRHTLGAVLLEAGHPVEAEQVYWDDLQRYRENGYALFGLWKSLEAQGRDEEAAAVKQRFRAAWRDADIQLTSSRF